MTLRLLRCILVNATFIIWFCTIILLDSICNRISVTKHGSIIQNLRSQVVIVVVVKVLVGTLEAVVVVVVIVVEVAVIVVV